MRVRMLRAAERDVTEAFEHYAAVDDDGRIAGCFLDAVEQAKRSISEREHRDKAPNLFEEELAGPRGRSQTSGACDARRSEEAARVNLAASREPRTGLEPATCGLRNRCSTN